MFRASRITQLILLVSLLPALSCSDDDNPAIPGGQAAPVQVTTFGASEPTSAPDGQHIAFLLTSPIGIARAIIGGAQLDTLALGLTDPDWATTGDLIIVRAGGSLATVNASTREVTPVGSGGIDGDPEWSPDGTEIAVRKTAGGDGIAIVTYPGGVLSVVPCVDQFGGACDGEGPTWSPDGLTIAFEDGLEILKVARSGGTASVVVDSLEDVTEPSWSPDGKWIAFVMAEPATSYQHIWVVDARGKAFGLYQITSGPAHDRRPAWSPDSKTIYFASERSSVFEIWKVGFAH